MTKPCAYLIASAIIIYCLFSVPEAHAHSPLISGDNERISAAMFIPDPTKSWAIYGELHEGSEANYYRFEIDRGQRIYISLMKPTNPEDIDFMPVFILMGPGLDSRGNIPEYVEQPSEVSAIVVAGEQPSEATYEPFSASSFYKLAELDILAPVSGTYYIAVYDTQRGGHYSLAIGDREVYSISEWILIPVRLISIYQWEGQSLIMIFSPIVFTLAISLGLVFWLRKNWIPQAPFEWAGVLAGLLFLGTGFMFLFQMALALTRTQLVPEILITIILAFLPVLLGILVIWTVMKNRERVDIKKRAYLAILGILSLFVWAGFLAGSVLAVLASVLPARKT